MRFHSIGEIVYYLLLVTVAPGPLDREQPASLKPGPQAARPGTTITAIPLIPTKPRAWPRRLELGRKHHRLEAEAAASRSPALAPPRGAGEPKRRHREAEAPLPLGERHCRVANATTASQSPAGAPPRGSPKSRRAASSPAEVQQRGE